MNTVIILKIRDLSECLYQARETRRKINGSGTVALIQSEDNIIRICVADKDGKMDPEQAIQIELEGG